MERFAPGLIIALFKAPKPHGDSLRQAARPVYVSSIGGSRHLSEEAADAIKRTVTGNVVDEPAPPIKPGVTQVPFACGPQLKRMASE